MSSIVLTEAQKRGSISYDELMDSLTEDLEQNYELIKRYILYNQLNGHKPFNIVHFVTEVNQKSSMLAVRTLLKYGMNPNSKAKIDKTYRKNYVAKIIDSGFDEKDIYEAIHLGLEKGLYINDRFCAPYNDAGLSLFDLYCGCMNDSPSFDSYVTKIRTYYDMSSFFEYLCKNGFSYIEKCMGLNEIKKREERYDKKDYDNVIRLYENWEKKPELIRNIKLKELSVPAYELGIEALKNETSYFLHLSQWGGLDMMLPLMTNDLEENYRIIEKFIDTEKAWKPSGYQLCIRDFLHPKYEEQSLLAVKTLLKNKYHPNVISLPIISKRLTSILCNYLTSDLHTYNNSSEEDFIFYAVRAGFSEKFIIEAIREALKYGYDINTMCRCMNLMAYIILLPEYKGKLTPIYKFLCENGYDSTLRTINEDERENYTLLEAIEIAKKEGKTFDEADVKLFEEMYNEEILKVKKFLGIVKTEKDSEEPTVETKERTSEKESTSIGKDYYDLLSNLRRQELEILSLKFKYKDEISSQDIAKLLSIDEKVVNDVLNKIEKLYCNEQKPRTRTRNSQKNNKK